MKKLVCVLVLAALTAASVAPAGETTVDVYGFIKADAF